MYQVVVALYALGRALWLVSDFQRLLECWVLATCLLWGVLMGVQFPKFAVLLLLLLLLPQAAGLLFE